MRLGPRGTALIQSYETLRLTAYLPTPEDVWTIGWGHTGPDVSEGLTMTTAEANRLFAADVQRFEHIVNQLDVPLTQAMFDALVSLAFNTGTLGATITRTLRAEDYFGAWAAFPLWRKQGTRDLLGLARRRAHEMDLFFADGLPA